MKNQILLFFAFIFLISCQSKINKKDQDSKHEVIFTKITSPIETNTQVADLKTETHLKCYNTLRNKILIKRDQINKSDLQTSEKEAEASSYISKILIDSIFYYWEGTPWDFNGHTNNPREGEVACGYYISTTLKHIGCKLNRYKLAQKSATGIIKDICHTSTNHFTDFNDLKSHLQNIRENELLVIGLDFHVGFIYKKNNQIYFAHSNYINRQGVVKELIDESIALKSSRTYLIGSISRNVKLAKNWLNQ